MVPAMAAAAVVMALHWGFSALAMRWAAFGKAIKGRSRLLVKNGVADEDAIRDAYMTRGDLREALREQGVSEVSSIAEARLERDGTVSVVKKAAEPRIVTVRVEDGVQTLRLELA